MNDVFLKQTFDPPLGISDVQESLLVAKGCFDLHGVDRQESFLSTDGRQMICRFSSPDTESVRTALRQADANFDAMWSGTVHDAPGLSSNDLDAANVLVARAFFQPVALEEIQAIEDKGAWCLDAHNVKFIRTFFSVDRTRMICLYKAPDAESVRLAQRQAMMPVEDVWSFTAVQ
jgi:hypothetical protein